jgi:hypothetical protein
MSIFRIFFWALFLFISNNAIAQRYITGKIMDRKDGKALRGCSIYNVSSQFGTVSNEDGLYRITVKNGDLVQFSFIGMEIQEYYIVDSMSELNVLLSYYVKPIKNVVISSKSLASQSILYNKNYGKKEDKPKQKLKSHRDYMKDAGPSMGVNGMSFSPISYLYYAFNKKEQRRLQAIQMIEKRDVSNLKYSYDFISTITKETDEDELQRIKRHCYFSEDEILESTYYELGVMLTNCYLDYLQQKK